MKRLNRFKRVVGGLIFAALALTLAAPAGSAAEGDSITDRVAVDIALVEVRATPGTAAGDSVKLINRTAEEIRLSPIIEDIGANADGAPIAVQRSTGQRSAAKWITIQPTKISLPPNGTAFAAIKISVPKGTTPGGYYAAVTFDTDSSAPPERRVVHAILVNVTGQGSKALVHLSSFKVSPLTVNGKVTFDAVVDNVGQVHAIGTGTIEVSNFGSRIATLQIPSIVVLPGIQRLVRVTLDGPPIAGRLTARLTIPFTDGEQEQGSTSGFVMIWWLAVALLAVAALFIVSLLRLAGAMGPKAKARHAKHEAQIAAAPETNRDRKRRERAELAASAMAAKKQAAAAKSEAKRHAKSGESVAKAAVAAPASAAPAPVVPASAAPASVAPASVAPARPAQAPDRNFWADDDDRFGPLAASDPSDGTAAAGDAHDVDADALENEQEAALLESVESPASGAGLTWGDDEQDERDESGDPRQLPADDDLDASWADSAPVQQPAPVPRPARPARPIAVAPSSRRTASPPTPARTDPVIPVPEAPELRPAGRARRQVQVAGLPPVRPQAGLPQSQWAAPPPETRLERPSGGAAPVMALRRAEVAMRMISGKPGETGAILDAGLDLLYSVRSEPSVIEHLEEQYAGMRNRRKLGPIALALFAVDSSIAPEALLDAYGSATKVVADRIRRALLACDPADVRRHRDLLSALPPARRDSLGI